MRKSASNTVNPSMNDFQVIIAPKITEKASLAAESANKVVFFVHRKANKDQIKRAVERIFKVEVAAVNTANYLGKVKRTTRSQGRRSAYKQAFVTLKEGHKINVVEGL